MQYICQYPILRVIARSSAFQRVFTFIYICVQYLCTRSQPPAFSIYNICVCTFFAVAAFFLKKKLQKFLQIQKKALLLHQKIKLTTNTKKYSYEKNEHHRRRKSR